MFKIRDVGARVRQRVADLRGPCPRPARVWRILLLVLSSPASLLLVAHGGLLAAETPLAARPAADAPAPRAAPAVPAQGVPDEQPEQQPDRGTPHFVTPSGQPDLAGPIDPQIGFILEHGVDDDAMQRKLVKLLSDRNPVVRKKAAIVVSNNLAMPPATVAAVAMLLLDPNLAVRAAAMSALAEQKSAARDAISQLIVALNDPDDGIASAAATELGRMGADAGTAVPALVAMISDPQRGSPAIEALGEIGAPARWAVPQLMDLFQENQESEVIVEALVKLGAIDAVRKDLLEKFKDDPHSGSVIGALGQFHPTDDAIIDALIEASHDQDQDVRTTATQALGTAKPANERTIAALGKILKSKNAEDREAAVSALATIEPKLPAAIPWLVAAMQDKNGSVSSAAMEALDNFKLPPEVRLRAFLPVVLDGYWAQGLSDLDANKGLGLLKPIITNKQEDEAVRAGALAALWKCEEDPHTHAKALSLELLAEAATPRDLAAEAAAQLVASGDRTSPRLLEVLLAASKNSPRVGVRISADLGLSRLGNPVGVEDLIKILGKIDENNDQNILRKAISALEELPPAQGAKAVPDLCRLVKGTTTSNGSAVCEVLGVIGKPTDVIIPALLDSIANGASGDDAAANSLAAIVKASPQEANRVTAALAALLKNPSSDSQREALVGLGQMPKKAVAPFVPAIAQRVTDEDMSTRSAALDTITAIGPEAASAAPLLIKALHAPKAADSDAGADEDEKTQILLALAAIQADPRLVVPEVLRYVDKEDALSDAAVHVICNAGPHAKAAVPALVRVLRQPWAPQRTAAAQALGAIGHDAAEAIDPLAKVYRDDPDSDVRGAAAEAILHIAPDRARALGIKPTEP